MEQGYALFDRRCRTQTAFAKLAKLRRCVQRFPSLSDGLKKLFAPTLEKALTFLYTDPLLQTYPSSTATVALTIGHDSAHPLQAQRQALLNGERCLHTIAPVAITHAEPQGDATIPAAPQTQ